MRTAEDAEVILGVGVSRIILGTAACENKNLVVKLIQKYSSEKIVIGIDAKDGKVAVKGWLEESSIDALGLASDFAKLGVKRFVYTDISRDGTLIGPNFKVIINFCNTVPTCNVIASGGIGSIEHVKKLEKISGKKTNLGRCYNRQSPL